MTQQEILESIKSEKRERMKAKAQRILDKINKNPVRHIYNIFRNKPMTQQTNKTQTSKENNRNVYKNMDNKVELGANRDNIKDKK